MAEKQMCPDCWHERVQHSRNGCTEPGCPCKNTYNEVGEKLRRQG